MRKGVLIVGGGLLQVPAIEIAREMGLYVVVTDARLDAPGMRIADEPVALDTYDGEGHAQLAVELKKRLELRGVFTEGADVEVTVATAAQAAGLPGVDPESARRCKNKVLMRKAFDRAGLPNPVWCEVRSRQEARRGAARIGLPLIVKATDNCASRGTRKLFSLEEIDEAYPWVSGNSTTGTALLERCFSGPEQSVEILFDETGRCHWLNVVDRPFSEGRWAMELGHFNPSELPPDRTNELFRLTQAAAEAVGFRFGAFKADTIWTAEGPRILEITGRLSGGFDCQYTTPLATGRNFIRAALRLAIGERLEPVDLMVKWKRHAVAWCAFPEPGRVARIQGLEEARRVSGVHHVFLRVAAGDLIEPYQHCAARPVFVIAEGATREEAFAAAKQALALLRIRTVREAAAHV